jgi:hypothetical protein
MLPARHAVHGPLGGWRSRLSLDGDALRAVDLLALHDEVRPMTAGPVLFGHGDPTYDVMVALEGTVSVLWEPVTIRASSSDRIQAT